MTNKAKHAFGTSANIQQAITDGKIDAYDILFLDGDTDPKIGWVDKNGAPVIVKGEEYVVKVDGETLPESGKDDVVYIFKNEGYIWNGTQFISLANSADVTALEQEVANKVDEATVDQKIETAISDLKLEVVEF